MTSTREGPSGHGPASPAQAGGQRRYVTVLFSDVSGSSEHAERLEAEDYSALLAAFREIRDQIDARIKRWLEELQGAQVNA